MSGKNDGEAEVKKKGVRFGVVIRRCNSARCESLFQDKTYGAGVRVHNRVGKASVPSARCTVCEAVKEL